MIILNSKIIISITQILQKVHASGIPSCELGISIVYYTMKFVFERFFTKIYEEMRII